MGFVVIAIPTVSSTSIHRSFKPLYRCATVFKRIIFICMFFLPIGGIAVISFVPCFLYVYKPICESHSIFVSTSLVYYVLPPKYFRIVVVPINRIHYLIKAWSFLSVDYNQIQQLCHSI